PFRTSGTAGPPDPRRAPASLRLVPRSGIGRRARAGVTRPDPGADGLVPTLRTRQLIAEPPGPGRRAGGGEEEQRPPGDHQEPGPPGGPNGEQHERGDDPGEV